MAQSRPERQSVKTIHVLMTMDCESMKKTSDATASGPEDWKLSEKAIRGYLAIAREFNLPVTYFIHPECATGQRNFWRELDVDDVERGLHLHAWKFANAYQKTEYYEHTGGLSKDKMRDILIASKAIFKEAIGCDPLSFRPGSYSFNDHGFGILNELGFTEGSCSVPDRVMPTYRANWGGARPDPHRANLACKEIEGSSDFVNVPNSVDFTNLLEGRYGHGRPSLSPEIRWEEYYGIKPRTIARNIFNQVVERDPEVAVVVLGNHNNRDYTDPKELATVQLYEMLREITKASEEAGVELVGATMADIGKLVRDIPPKTEELVLSGGVYEPRKNVCLP